MKARIRALGCSWMGRPECARAAVLALLTLLPSSGVGAAEPPVLELRPHDTVLDVELLDMDPRPGLELVVASARATGPESAQRFIGVYRVSAAGDEPAKFEGIAEYEVPDDVVAFGVGDLLGSGRKSLVYFTAQSVYALDPAGKPKPVVRGQRFFFSMPSPSALPYWDAVIDLDGDQRDDLLLADARGYVIYRRPRGGEPGQALERIGRVEVGFDYAKEPLRRRRRSARDEGPIVMWRSLRQVTSADLNADKRLDLIAMKRNRLLGYLQKEDGSFSEVPDTSHRIVSNKGMPFAAAQAAPPPAIVHGDFDLDGRDDYVVPELDLSELQTRLRVFLSSADGLPENPTQILKLSSLGTEPELMDANGDGHLDLGLTVFRSDRLLSLAPSEIRTLDFTYYVFLFDPEERLFSRSPDLRFEASWSVPQGEDPADDRESDDEPGFIRFGGDFTGDGLRDAALFTAEGAFSVFPLRVSGDDRRALKLADEASIQVTLPPTTAVDFGDLSGDSRSDAVFVYKDSLRVVLAP